MMSEETTLSTATLIERLAEVGDKPAFAALAQAIDRWPEVSEPLLQAIGEAMTPEAESLACWAIYLAAHQRDPRALPLLCALAAHEAGLDHIIGDGTTLDFPAILVRIYGGDPAPLRALIEAEHADQFLRGGALIAMAWLTLEGRIEREATGGFLRWLHEHGRPRTEDYVWAEWAVAVAALGLEDLLPLVEAAFSDGRIDDTIVGMEEIRDICATVTAGGDAFEALDGHLGPRMKEMDDFMAFISDWKWTKPGEHFDEFDDEEAERGRVVFSDGTYHNPYRNVGRNDPCPCGSGKKFKKCCLGVAG